MPELAPTRPPGGSVTPVNAPALADEVERAVKKYRMRLIGPNCLGIAGDEMVIDLVMEPRSGADLASTLAGV